MRTRIPPEGSPRRGASRLAPLARLAACVAVALSLPACHPGNQEAKRLRAACERGEAAACNTLAARLRKGEYVLRDDARAAALFDRACTGGVGEGCASLGAMLQRGAGGLKARLGARVRDAAARVRARRAMDGCTRLGVLYRAARACRATSRARRRSSSRRATAAR